MAKRLLSRTSSSLCHFRMHYSLNFSSQIYNLGINMSIGACFMHIGLWYGKDVRSPSLLVDSRQI